MALELFDVEIPAEMFQEEYVEESDDPCNAQTPSKSFACTRNRRHNGPHVAIGMNWYADEEQVFAIWN